MSAIRCPSCRCELLAVEKRPDGNAKCTSCGWHGAYSLCFDNDIKKLKQQILDAENVIKEYTKFSGYTLEVTDKYWEKYERNNS